MSKRITTMVVLGAAGAVALAAQLRAATQEEIQESITQGVAWLVAQQKADGSWGDYEPVAHTGLAVVKLEEMAFELGYAGPFDDAYPYKARVVAGLDYVFSQAGTYDGGPIISRICFAKGAHETYNTGIAMMAIAASRAPGRVVNVPASLVNGWTYQRVLQACADFFAMTQNPDGGWRYQWGSQPSDNSNTGYAVLGLRYAEAPAYGFAIPMAAVKPGLNNWITLIQDPVNGDPDDGGSWYDQFNPWVNLLKTGNLLFEMSFFGDTTGTPRVQDAVDYIERHWNDPNEEPGWRPAHYQSMYCLMKGLASLGIDTLVVGGSPVDWYSEFADAIVVTQQADGSWPANQWGDSLLSTAWALLVLEKVAPPPPVEVTVNLPDCACDVDGYTVEVVYRVERFTVDGTVEVYRDGSLVLTVVLDDFTGEASVVHPQMSDTPGAHVWKAELDVIPVGGGTPGHDEDLAVIRVCETPQVGDIPDQITPFLAFDLDDYLTYTGPLAVSWSVSGVPPDWTVTIDVGNVVTVTAPDDATDPVTLTFTASVTCCAGVVCSDSDDAVFVPNRPPDCTTAYPSVALIWPPNHKFVPVQVWGVTDPDGDPVTITITGIRQDETVDTYGDGTFTPDGAGVGTDTAWLRAERAGTKKVPGDGRVYHVFFTATDDLGAWCEGEVLVGVPHDVKDIPVDGGPLYDSTALAP